MDSPFEQGSAPRDALRASLVAGHEATLRSSRRDGVDDAGKAGAVDEAAERPYVSAEADTESALAAKGTHDLKFIEAVFVAAAVAAAQHVVVKKEAVSGRLVAEKASEDNGREAVDKDYPDEFLLSARPVPARSVRPRVAAVSVVRT